MNVYDFDNTLYDGESGIDMFFLLLKRKPLLIRFGPVIAVGMLQYKRHRLTLDDVLRKYAKVVEVFIDTIHDVMGDSKAFWDKKAHKFHSFYQDLQQPDDLVISANPEQSLAEACKRLGIQRWIGTDANMETRTLDFICYGENKAKAFLERYPDDRIDCFYTDSMNDKPLMDLAAHVFLVKKGKIVKQLK